MSVNLRTTYLGLELANPLVPSASTLSSRIDTLKQLQDAGAAAIVMQSLFEEQIEHEELQIHRLLEAHTESFAEALTHFPDLEEYNTGPDEYLRHLEACERELQIPVIGSLNGASEGGWVRYAKLIQDAGADALELNVYLVAADPDETGAQVERRYLDLVSAVRSSVSIPLAVKVGPYFSSTANMARRIVEAGADGLVLFNRFLQPDIDLETLAVDPTLHLSTSEELRLPLRWIAILFGFLGYIFLKLGCEPAPLLLGYILGPMLEENLRRALVLSRGDYTVFATRPMSAVMLLMACGLLALMIVPAIRKKREAVFQES